MGGGMGELTLMSTLLFLCGFSAIFAVVVVWRGRGGGLLEGDGCCRPPSGCRFVPSLLFHPAHATSIVVEAASCS